jgi:hypothetical protein
MIKQRIIQCVLIQDKLNGISVKIISGSNHLLRRHYKYEVLSLGIQDY